MLVLQREPLANGSFCFVTVFASENALQNVG